MIGEEHTHTHTQLQSSCTSCPQWRNSTLNNSTTWSEIFVRKPKTTSGKIRELIQIYCQLTLQSMNCCAVEKENSIEHFNKTATAVLLKCSMLFSSVC